MAASLAVEIKTALGLEADLVEGHNGIYEVAVAGDVVYSNSRTCKTGFPDHGDIIEAIASATGLTCSNERTGAAGATFPLVGDTNCGESKPGCCGEGESN